MDNSKSKIADVGELDAIDKPSSSAGRILVVDDERNIRSSLSMVLTNNGFTVDLAADGDEAEKLWAEREFDVVLLDVRMPGRSGLQLLQKWKAESPESTYILMSGEASLSEALEGLKIGAFDFIEKPILTARLLTTLKHAVERSLSKRRIDLGHGESIVGDSAVIKKVMNDATKIAHTKARVLINGESGTGKDLLARFIHLSSARRDRPFVKINCASIPAELVESELFGHVKGAFTGAVASRRGHFECANGGTLFLDEIGELPLAAQAKMLRTLQSGEVTPVGSNQTQMVDVRVIAATNRDLKAEIASGRFREDLYYRLAVVTLESPSLRARSDDVLKLAKYFVHSLCEEYGVSVKSFDSSAEKAILAYKWPGNIRELRNVIERCMILGSSVITVSELPLEISSCLEFVNMPSDSQEARDLKTSHESGQSSGTIEPWHVFKSRSEREHVIKAIDATGGNMTEAAKLLQVERQTMYKWIKAYGIKR